MDKGTKMFSNTDRPLKRDDHPNPAKYVGVVLLLSFVLFLVFLPVWPYALALGYWPAVGFGIVAFFALLFLLMGSIAEKRGDPRHR